MEALAFWQELGLPETAFIKFDSARYPNVSDREALAHNDLSINSLRTDRIWHSEQSTLRERLRQLCPRSDAGKALIERPGDFQPPESCFVRRPAMAAARHAPRFENWQTTRICGK